VYGLRTPRNNASANALVNADSRIYCVHKLAYYMHDMATVYYSVVVVFCADAFFRASHLKLLTYSYVMWSQIALVVALLA